MNTLWIFLILTSFVFYVVNNKLSIFTDSIFEGARNSIELFLKLAGILAVWMGILKVVEDSGLVEKISRSFRFITKMLFKDVPQNHPAISNITLNMVANMLGAGNAATPAGLKAMQNLNDLNEKKDTISDSMMLFIVVNTASIQLIPFTLVGLLKEYGSVRPEWIVVPTIVATILSLISSLIVYFLFKKIWK